MIFERIVGAVGDKGTDPFSSEEVDKLAAMLGCSTGGIKTLCEGGSYVFERAAYNGVNGGTLAEVTQRRSPVCGAATPEALCWLRGWRDASGADNSPGVRARVSVRVRFRLTCFRGAVCQHLVAVGMAEDRAATIGEVWQGGGKAVVDAFRGTSHGCAKVRGATPDPSCWHARPCQRLVTENAFLPGPGAEQHELERPCQCRKQCHGVWP